MVVAPGEPGLGRAAEVPRVTDPTRDRWWLVGSDRRGSMPPLPSHEGRPDLPRLAIAEAEALRQSAKLGPARLAGIVGVPASTVHRVLVRHGLNRLRWKDWRTGTDRATDRDQSLRRTGPHRRQEAGAAAQWLRSSQARANDGTRRSRGSGGSCTCIHTAIDAYSRLAYGEFAGIENAKNCVAILDRGRTSLPHQGIRYAPLSRRRYAHAGFEH